MNVFSFPRGGLRFSDPTVPPEGPSVTAFLPTLSVIPLVQHSGGQAHPLVSVGDVVQEGMLVGKGAGPGSANVHATVPGKVIRMVSWSDCHSRRINALVIRTEGAFERLGRQEEYIPWKGLPAHAIRHEIAEYGVVEMEGAGQPAAETLSTARGAAERLTLVVRCVFDDPWLAADYALCRERLAAVVEGSFIAAKAAEKTAQVLFAVSTQANELGKALLSEAHRWKIPAIVVPVGSRYPQRNHRELELVLRNYAKKEGLDLGSLLVFGPATLAAVYDAVCFKRPILDRYVAVGGSAVHSPQVMKVRIGKRIGDLIDECGGFVGLPWLAVTGSPLAGKKTLYLDEPVTKTSYAVCAMLKAQVGDYARRDCIGCGECRRVCPVGLDPEERYKQIVTAAAGSGDEGCHGCGCCDLVCPSRLPLSEVILGKSGEVKRA